MALEYIAVATTPDDAELRAAAVYDNATDAELAARHYADDGIGARSGFYAVPDGAVHQLPRAVWRAYSELSAGRMRPHRCRLCGGDGGELAGAYRDNAGMPYTLAYGADARYVMEWRDGNGTFRSVRLTYDDAERLVRRSTWRPS